MSHNTTNVLIVAIIAGWGAIASVAHAWRDRARPACGSPCCADQDEPTPHDGNG